MLGKTLQRLIDENLTTASEIGELAGVSTSTVYRWITGQSQPNFHSIRLLLRHLPHPRAQEAILIAFAAGTGWRFIPVEMNPDINADGRVDAHDALDAAVVAVKSVADSLERVRQACRSHNAVLAEEAHGAIRLLRQSMRQCAVAERVLVEITQKRRRKPKPAR